MNPAPGPPAWRDSDFLLHALHVPVLSANGEGNIVYVNEAMAAILDATPARLDGCAVSERLGLPEGAMARILREARPPADSRWREVLTDIRYRDQRRGVRLHVRWFPEAQQLLVSMEGLEWWHGPEGDALAGTRLVFFEADSDGALVHGRRRWAGILGYSEEEEKTANLFRVVAEEQLEAFESLWSRVRGGEVVRSQEIAFLDAQNHLHPLAVSLFPLNDLEGRLIGVRGTASDLQVEKGLAYALEAAEERFSVLFRESSDPIFILSMQGDILSANQTFEDLTGCTSEALFSGEKAWADFIAHEDLEIARSGVDRCLREQANVTAELRYRSAGGSSVWFEQRYSILHNEHGAPKGILAVARNIHDRKQRELELRAEARSMHERNLQAQALIGRLTEFFSRTSALPPDLDAYLRGICSILGEMYQPFMVWIHLEEGNRLYTFVRDGATAETDAGGRLRDIPTSLCRRVVEEGLPLFYDQLQEDALLWQDPLVERHGLNTYLGAPLRDSHGAIQGTLALVDVESRFVDKMDVELITVAALQVAARLRMYEEEEIKTRLEGHLRQAQKMEAVGMLAGGIAHDFNNILSGILGFTSFLRTRVESGSDLHRDLGLIETSAERAADLTRRLLAFARRKHFAKTTIRLNEVVAETVNILRHSLPKQIQIQSQLDDCLPLVLGDPGQVGQVVMNLCINAGDAMAERGGRLLVETRHAPLDERERALLLEDGGEHDDYLCLRVSDTGVGMPEEVLAQVFDPFFTTKSKKGGTGLGLSIVYGIVSNHGGDILAESVPGQGSSFSVYLPVYRGEAMEEEEEQDDLPVEGTECVLVVDDELVVRQMVQGILKPHGYRVHLAASGDDAVEMFPDLKDEIDLVLLDMVMPGMNGEATFRALRELSANVPVLLTTGFAKEGQSERLVQEGALGVLYKPYKSQALLRAIRKALNRAPAETGP